ncbi:uncharacterized protein LOC100215564 isoform X1 [Hydra vulgaris]|uniref:Uncharacterized protein LOC100215564 isoform X1 n=1 Tax=Hydra vulgaris TaxID=6087 RepID=A0ABM4BBS4_HYDVU
MSICSQLCQHPGCWRALQYENHNPSMLNFCLELKEKENVSEFSKKIKVDRDRPAACNYTFLNLLDYYNKNGCTTESEKNTIDKSQIMCEDHNKLSGDSGDDNITKHLCYHFKELHLSLDQNPCELNDKVYKWVPGRKKEKIDSTSNSSGLATVVIDGKILPDECNPLKHKTKRPLKIKSPLSQITSPLLPITSPLLQITSPLVSELEPATDDLLPEFNLHLKENEKLHENVFKDDCKQNSMELKNSITMAQSQDSETHASNLLPLISDLSDNCCTSQMSSSSKDIHLLATPSPQLPTTNVLTLFEKHNDSKKQANNSVIYSKEMSVNAIENTAEVAIEGLSSNLNYSLSLNIFNKSTTFLDSDLEKSHLKKSNPEISLQSTDKIGPHSYDVEVKDLQFIEQNQGSPKLQTEKQLNFGESTSQLVEKPFNTFNITQSANFGEPASQLVEKPFNVFNVTQSANNIRSHKALNQFSKEVHVEEPHQKNVSPEKFIDQKGFQSAVVITLNKQNALIDEDKKSDAIPNSLMPKYMRSTNNSDISFKIPANIAELYDENALSDLTSLSSDVDYIVNLTKELNFEWNPEQDLCDAINDLSEILSS